MQTTKRWFFTSAPLLYACRCSFATSTHVCNVLLTDFVKKSGFECCFWSTQCTESQARTSDIVKIWVSISLNVQWWSFIDIVVYCNILRSIKAAFRGLEKSNVHRRNSCSDVYYITPSPYTHSKQPKAFHAKCNLKVNCEEKWV